MCRAEKTGLECFTAAHFALEWQIQTAKVNIGTTLELELVKHQNTEKRWPTQKRLNTFGRVGPFIKLMLVDGLQSLTSLRARAGKATRMEQFLIKNTDEFDELLVFFPEEYCQRRREADSEFFSWTDLKGVLDYRSNISEKGSG